MDDVMSGPSLYLIGLGLDPDFEDPEFYFILQSDETCHDVPLTQEQRILLFRHPREIERCMAAAGPPYNTLPAPGPEPNVILDINQALYFLQEDGLEDQHRVILHVLNILFDVIDATVHSIPKATKRLLYDAADYFTFETNVEGFFADGKKTWAKVIDGVLWLVGAVFANARLLEAMDEDAIAP
jgi:hypothetical protein